MTELLWCCQFLKFIVSVMEWVTVVELYWYGKTGVLVDKPLLLPCCIPQIPRRLAWGWTWTPMVTCWELTASAMAWLLDCWNTWKDLGQFWLKSEPGILWRWCNNADHCNATFSQGQISMDEGAENLAHFNVLSSICLIAVREKLWKTW